MKKLALFFAVIGLAVMAHVSAEGTPVARR
jgi:hypothetical protein